MNNSNNKKNYTLTKEGYENLLNELKQLKKRFNDNERAMSLSIQNAPGDGPHDNAEFEALQGQEKLLVGQIDRLEERLRIAKIIEVPKLDETQINVNDTVLLRLIYDEDDIVEDIYTLVGTDGDMKNNKISINSPIGSAIFQRRIGEIVPFVVNDSTFNVAIVEKIHYDSTIY